MAQRMDEAIDVSRVRGLAEGKGQGFAEGKEPQRAMSLHWVARQFEANTAVHCWRLSTISAALPGSSIR